MRSTWSGSPRAPSTRARQRTARLRSRRPRTASPLAPCRIFVEADPSAPGSSQIGQLLIDHCVLAPVRTRSGGSVATLTITDSIVQGLPATRGTALTEADVFDPALLARGLAAGQGSPADPVSAALLAAMPSADAAAILAYAAGSPPGQGTGFPLAGLNALVGGHPLYSGTEFATVKPQRRRARARGTGRDGHAGPGPDSRVQPGPARGVLPCRARRGGARGSGRHRAAHPGDRPGQDRSAPALRQRLDPGGLRGRRRRPGRLRPVQRLRRGQHDPAAVRLRGHHGRARRSSPPSATGSRGTRSWPRPRTRQSPAARQAPRSLQGRRTARRWARSART